MPRKKDDKKLISSNKNDGQQKEIILSKKDDDKPKNRDTGNVFDRIFRENSSRMIAWIERRYGYKIEKYTLLKEKIPKTLEREIDFLCKIKTKKYGELLLHMEFQSADNNEMIYRMQEYHALISRKYKLPVRQVVMYMGEEESKMITQLPIAGIFTGFDLISVHKIDIEEFISDQFPEVIVMALLSNYDKENIEKVLYTIVDNIKKVVKHEDTLKRYINQLLILSRLRNLEESVTKILEDMPITFEVDVENDYLYKRGLEKGKEVLREEILKKEEEFKEQILKKEEQILKKEEESLKKSIIGFFNVGTDIKTIAKALKITQKRVKKVIEEWKQKEN